MPWALNRVCQNVLTNSESRSETMVFDNPKRRQISIEKRCAKVGVVKWVGKATKCAYFVKRSQTTHMIVCPAKKSKWVIKSMDKSSHTFVGIGKGWSNPYRLCERYLLC